MSFASDLLATITSIRGLPGQLGLRPHTVALVEQSWSGDHTGQGTLTETSTPIVEGGSQPPRVHWLTEEQRLVSGLPQGTVQVGPITPEHQGGGTDLSGLVGVDLSAGETRHLRITGPMHPTPGALYRITSVMADRALRYMVRATPVE